MFGYLLSGLLAFIFIMVCVAGLIRSGPRTGRDRDLPKPLQPEKPAADEATPDRSHVASPHEIASARRHTPPA